MTHGPAAQRPCGRRPPPPMGEPAHGRKMPDSDRARLTERASWAFAVVTTVVVLMITFWGC